MFFMLYGIIYRKDKQKSRKRQKEDMFLSLFLNYTYGRDSLPLFLSLLVRAPFPVLIERNPTDEKDCCSQNRSCETDHPRNPAVWEHLRRLCLVSLTG
jgi:hypothetical protein